MIQAVHVLLEIWPAQEIAFCDDCDGNKNLFVFVWDIDEQEACLVVTHQLQIRKPQFECLLLEE